MNKLHDISDQDLEALSQFIDGESTEVEARTLRERLLAEPDLRAQYEHMKTADTRVRAAFSAKELEAVPPHVAAALGQDVVPAAGGTRFAWHHGAVAASVLAAAVLLVSPQWGGDPMDDATLASVLDSAPSSASGWEALPGGDAVRPLLSFRNVEGAYCREYLLRSGDSAQRGVACRDVHSAGGWTVQVTVAQSLPGEASDYRPANSHDVDAIADYVAEHAAGDVLSLEEEAAAMSRGWQ
jgi:hypothetical protein